MTIAEIVANREPEWQELEELIRTFRSSGLGRNRSSETVARFTRLYRSVGSDLELAESYQFPPEVVVRLNELTRSAYQCLYRREGFSWSDFRRVVFFQTPRWIITDGTFWVALALFWIPFLVCETMSKFDVEFARNVVGSDTLYATEQMYSREFPDDMIDRIPMVAFYASHNGGIGLRCFAFGVLGCFPGAYILLRNSIFLGCVFGFMTSGEVATETSARFCEFTSAHGPFELTAIVLSAAAGLRIGFGLVKTGGYARLDSMRRAAYKAAPTACVAFALFCLAGTIEAFVSPNPMTSLADAGVSPLFVKKGIEWLSILLLALYFGGLGGIGVLQRLGKRGGVKTTSLRKK